MPLNKYASWGPAGPASPPRPPGIAQVLSNGLDSTPMATALKAALSTTGGGTTLADETAAVAKSLGQGGSEPTVAHSLAEMAQPFGATGLGVNLGAWPSAALRVEVTLDLSDELKCWLIDCAQHWCECDEEDPPEQVPPSDATSA